ncbi:MAG: peptidylprolyl isomerase [Thermoplasmata archaeon]|jgi:FKBP-type peptidyl-prolyl cis-trans isomerase 2|nr:peptidylprolyl isomerase [Thermoplasmata archaeon]
MTEKEGAKKHHEKEEKAETEAVKVEAGDVVLAEFDAWIQDTNELFDTTSETVAKENNAYNEKMVYGAQPLIVGKNRLFPGLDESLLKAEVGKEYEVVIPSEKAAGPRDPKLVELHPVREFLKQEIEPRVGLEVTVKNKPAIITAVTAGRVRVDFNNKLAGRTLKYKYKVIEKPTKPEEIVKLLLKLSYGNPEGFDVEHHGKTYKIKLPDPCKYDQRWFLTKFRFVTDMREVLGAENISFLEEYTKPEKKEEPKKKEAKPAEEKKAEQPEETKRAPEELTEEDRKKLK